MGNTKLERAKARLAKLEARFARLKKRFERDKRLTPREKQVLKSVAMKMKRVREKLGIKDFEGEGLDLKTELKPYDDVTFRTAFAKSIKDWSQDGNIALNRVKTYFIQSTGPSGISVGDILTVAEVIMTSNPAAQAYIKALKTAAGLVTAAYKAQLPATPSLHDIHSNWASALTHYGNQNHDVEFDQFVAAWRKKNKVPADSEKVPVNLFLPACSDYGKNYLPRQKDVETEFLGEILANVKDGSDWDLNTGLEKAGVAEVYMYSIGGGFRSPKVQIDDVSKQLMTAVKTVWKNHRIIDLPVQVYFRMENTNGANMAEFQRKSKTPGNTRIEFHDGDRSLYERFMKQKAWNQVKVSHIEYDGV